MQQNDVVVHIKFLVACIVLMDFIKPQRTHIFPSLIKRCIEGVDEMHPISDPGMLLSIFLFHFMHEMLYLELYLCIYHNKGIEQ